MEHGYSVLTSLLLYHLAEKNCGNTVDDDCHHVSAQLVKWPDVDSSYCMDWILLLPLPVGGNLPPSGGGLDKNAGNHS